MRATIRGRVQDAGFSDAVVRRAHELGLLGWVREDADGAVRVHAEGEEDRVRALREFVAEGPPDADVTDVDEQVVKVEGHEQFAVRGVPAGEFVVLEGSRGFELRLEVDGGVRAWALPRGPSMDPKVRRMAVEAQAGEGEASAWDRGPYEQGGRVPWPEALDRGHAVFVLHGEKLRGGFALQRTRGTGPGSQWLLVKRRDEHARPGSDVVAE